MTAEYNAFSRPSMTAEDFERAHAETASDSPMFAAPIYARDNTSRATRRGPPMAALVAVPVVALALGAGIYAMNQPHRPTTGVAQLTPGQPAAASTPAAASPTLPIQRADTTPPAASTATRHETVTPATRTAQASPRVSTRVAATTTTHRASRSAASAQDTGMNASATVATPAPTAPPPAATVAPTPPAVSATPPVAPPDTAATAPATAPQTSTAPVTPPSV